MRFYTHIAFSFLIGLLLIKYLSIPNQILFIVLFVLSGLLADIDKIGSQVSQRFKITSFFINIFVGHRGLFHSIWIPLLLYLSLFLIKIEIAIAVSFGYLSHIILDCFTVSGVKLLWPLQKRLRGFVKSGGLAEYAIFVMLLFLDLLILLRF
jgi:inner membrane protein